jgi:hypothetical protein
LVVTVGGTAVRRDVIVAAAAKHRLSAISPYRYFASDGSSLLARADEVIE